MVTEELCRSRQWCSSVVLAQHRRLVRRTSPEAYTSSAGILISPALAHGTKGSEISGGGVALLIILGVAILFGLICLGLKRWRRRKLESGGEVVPISRPDGPPE